MLASVATLHKDANILKNGFTHRNAFAMVMAAMTCSLPVAMVATWKAIMIAMMSRAYPKIARLIVSLRVIRWLQFPII